MECLIYAREHGCDWNSNTCSAAARYGHLNCLIWAREHGCPWNESTCSSAAQGGHLNCLIWAREHECPWNEYTCTVAAYGGHLDCFVWALEHGCPLVPAFEKVMYDGSSSLPQHIKDWIASNRPLIEHGIPLI